MSLSGYFDLFLPAIEEHLHETLKTGLASAFPELRDAILYHFGYSDENAPTMKGKRIRPMLVLLTAELLSMDWRSMLPAATAVELLHNSSLIHDDIEDHSPLRRGRETVWKKWGNEKAINIGNVLFILSVQTIQSSATCFDLQRSHHAEQSFINTAGSIMQGQEMDMAFAGNVNVTVADYLQMIQEKTAALLALCCEVSAILDGCEPDVQKKLHDFGLNVGMAFQIYDDWLGIWGSEGQTGKPEFSDLFEKKLSYPVLLGLEQSENFRNRWRAWRKITNKKAQKLCGMLSREGIEKQVLEKAAYYNDIGLQTLESITGKEEAKDALRMIANDLIKRNH